MIERALRAPHDGLGAERRRHIEGATNLHAAEVTIGDADDREDVAIERDRFADGVGAAAEFALPETVTQHRDGPIRPTAAPVIAGREGPAEMRGHAERVEESAADEQALRGSRFATRAQVETGVAVRGDAHQDVLMIADVLPLRIGQRVGVTARIRVAEDDEPIRVVDRQRLQNQRVHEREDGDVGADAQGQREQGHAADDRRLPHLPEGEFQVTAE